MKRVVLLTILAFVVLLLATGGWVVGGIVACHRALMPEHRDEPDALAPQPRGSRGHTLKSLQR